MRAVVRMSSHSASPKEVTTPWLVATGSNGGKGRGRRRSPRLCGIKSGLEGAFRAQALPGVCAEPVGYCRAEADALLVGVVPQAGDQPGGEAAGRIAVEVRESIRRPVSPAAFRRVGARRLRS